MENYSLKAPCITIIKGIDEYDSALKKREEAGGGGYSEERMKKLNNIKERLLKIRDVLELIKISEG